MFCSLNVYSIQPFKIVANNMAKRAVTTDTIKSGEFVLGICDYGGGYINQLILPGIGNIMGIQAQRYGRGGQSSIRDMGRKGNYNPTQAGFSDNAGTECEVIKTKGKMVVPPRGCVLYNGDGGFDYIRWENITADPYDEAAEGRAANASDLDYVDEENLSVIINGLGYTKQEAEVYSDFDFYCNYENIKGKHGIIIPAIRHYLEYRFVRSSTMPNACMKQFSKSALSAKNLWDVARISSDISSANPSGIHPGAENDLNGVVLSWSIRNDLSIWNPGFRYVQQSDGTWQVLQRTAQFQGLEPTYKLRFIVAESNNENTGRSIGFYRPDSEINKNNILGIKESVGSEVYTDNRVVDNFFLDVPTRTPEMSWIGFRSEYQGLIDRSRLIGAYAGVYEKLRQETIVLYGTPAEIKAAFIALDASFLTKTSDFSTGKIELFPNPASKFVTIRLGEKETDVSIFNSMGAVVYRITGAKNEVMLPVNEFGGKGIYFIKANNCISKLLVR